jgi:hypothetical protein
MHISYQILKLDHVLLELAETIFQLLDLLQVKITQHFLFHEIENCFQIEISVHLIEPVSWMR